MQARVISNGSLHTIALGLYKHTAFMGKLVETPAIYLFIPAEQNKQRDSEDDRQHHNHH